MKNFVDTEITRELCGLIANHESKIVTHCGNIHGDDPYACASGAMLMPNPYSIKYERLTNDQVEEKKYGDSNVFIVDIGGGRFDHHFDPDDPVESKNIRYYPEVEGEEPVMMASVARVWDYCGPNIVRETMLRLTDGAIDPIDEYCVKVAKTIVNRIIKGLSDTDTHGQGLRPNPITSSITNRSALANALGKNMNELFETIVHEAISILEANVFNEYIVLQNTDAIPKLAEDAKRAGHKYWYNQTREWNGFGYIKPSEFKNTDIRFVVLKNNRDGRWNVNCVDSSKWPITSVVTESDGYYKHGEFWASFNSEKAAEDAAAVLSHMLTPMWKQKIN